MTDTKHQGRYSIRLDAGKGLELGEWLKSHQDILQVHTRAELADMATAALGFPVSESSVKLQGHIRGIKTGHDYTKRKPKATADTRLDRLEADIRTLAKLLQSYGLCSQQDSLSLENMINRLGDKK